MGYLDRDGLAYLWNKVKKYVDERLGGGEDTVAREMALEAKTLAEKALNDAQNLIFTTIRTDVATEIITSRGFSVLSEYMIIHTSDNFAELSVADVVILVDNPSPITLNSAPQFLDGYTSSIQLFYGYSQIHKYNLSESNTLVNEKGNPPNMGEIINMKIFYGVQKEV